MPSVATPERDAISNVICHSDFDIRNSLATLFHLMDQWLMMAGIVFSVFAVMVVGGVARRVNWVTHEADESLLKLVINVLLPCFIFNVIAGNPRLLLMHNVWQPPVVGFVSITLGCLIALVVANQFGGLIGLKDARERRTFAICVGIFNYGYIPIPLVNVLYGDDGTLGILLLHNTGVEVAMWTVAVMILAGGLKGQWWRRLFNPPLYAIVFALLLNFSNLHGYVPGWVRAAVKILGDTAIPMGLVMIGATIADHWNPAGVKRGTGVVVMSIILRLGLIPVLFMVAARYLPVTVELKRVVMIEGAMPAAVFPILLAKHYNGDAPTALRVVLGTGIAALITIPLWLAFAPDFVIR